MYRVLKKFADLQDNNHIYLAGDEYPRGGLEVDEGRIAELSGPDNKVGEPLIAEENAEIVAEESAEKAAEEKPKRKRSK